MPKHDKRHCVAASPYELGQYHYLAGLPCSANGLGDEYSDFRAGWLYERAEHLSLPNMEHLR